MNSTEDRSKDEQRRELLLKVYQAAIDEYRFNVNLSWERTRFFLGLISTSIAAGVGLMRFAAGNYAASLFLMCFFALLIFVTHLAIKLLEKGKEYTQEAVYKKTLIERELGLLQALDGLDTTPANLSIAVTGGMQNAVAVLMRSKQRGDTAHPLISSHSIVASIRRVLYAMIVIEAFGVVAAWFNVASKASSDGIFP